MCHQNMILSHWIHQRQIGVELLSLYIGWQYTFYSTHSCYTLSATPHPTIIIFKISGDNKKQLSCIWCCQKGHDDGNMYSQLGYKTCYKCSICHTVLCIVPHFGGESCFTQFHNAMELNKPCDSDCATVAHSHSNTALPPVQRKNDADETLKRASSSTVELMVTKWWCWLHCLCNCWIAITICLKITSTQKHIK